MLKDYKDDNLKPCPFCGAEAIISKFTSPSTGVEKWYVGCSKEDCCDIERHFKTKEQAMAEWNSRSTEEIADNICEKICRWRERALMENKDPDDAEKWLERNYCMSCPTCRLR